MKKAAAERLLLGVLALLLFIPFLRPSALYRQGGMFVTLMNVYRLAASALALPIWLLFFKRPSPMLCLIALYQAWLCVCTALAGENWTDAAQTALYTIAFCAMMEWLLRHDPALLYATLLPLLETIVLVNLATLLLFPSGLYTYVGYQSGELSWKAPAWLLGPKNNHFPLLLFSLLLSSLRAARRKRSRDLDARAALMALAVGLTAALLASGNTLFSMALALLFLCLPRRLKTWPAFRMDALLAAAAGVFVLLVVLRVQEVFRVLIVDVLGKQLDFTGRTSVWDAALYWIRKSPWIGYGVEELSDITRKLGFYFAVNAHNELLQMLYQGGVPLLAVFLWMMWLLVRRLKAQSAPTALCAAFVFVLLLSTQFEVYSTSSLFFLLLLLAYHCDTATALPREKAANDG